MGSTTPDPAPPGPVHPAGLFLWLRWLQARNSFRQLWGQSGLRPLTYVLSSLVVCSFVFVISYSGFLFLKQGKIPLAGGIVGVLFDMLFFALGLMLVFSTALILYNSLFTAPETGFLLASPAGEDHIFAYKYHSAVAFSSWAFVLLGAPILIAYGLVAQAPWYFYALLPLFFFGFVLLPGAAGALACLLLVNFLPRGRRLAVAAVIVLLVLGLGYWLYQVAASSQIDFDQANNRDAVQNLLGRFELARATWMPSHWVSEGLRTSAREDWPGSLYYLALLWSNGLFQYMAVTWLARATYRRGFNLIRTGGAGGRKPGGHWLDRLLEGALFTLDEPMRLLIVKDFRTFRRDPAQWAQILIFTGLMLLYFLNIRRLFLEDIGAEYRNAISALNLCSVALLLCTYTGRFIYPLLSLEGRKMWVLGLLPFERQRLLWGKFAFAATGTVGLATALIIVSDVMVGVAWHGMLIHVLTVVVLAAGLSGLSVGLGALLPNFRETDPSKIAVGFGGTLNLVVGLGYLLAVVAFISGPWHMWEMFGAETEDMEVWWLVSGSLGVVVGVGLGIMAVLFPLEAGARRLRAMEF